MPIRQPSFSPGLSFRIAKLHAAGAGHHLPFPTIEEMQFFRRMKAVLDSRETHCELLKLVKLIAQDFIDRASLVRSFIGEGEPMAQSRDILGWDKAMERSALAKEREDLYQPPTPMLPLTILDHPSHEEMTIRFGSYRCLHVRPCHFASLQSHVVKGCAGKRCRAQWPA